MKEEAQRRAIATSLGWTELHLNSYGSLVGKHKDHPEEVGFCYVPNYLLNLNAMHEAEDTLTLDQRIQFGRLLSEIIQRDDSKGGAWFATAAQRAEVFLKTLGLYE